MDKYRRVDKWWQDKDRECIFCHSKLSVKYDVAIVVDNGDSIGETWEPCCNLCTWRYVFGAK